MKTRGKLLERNQRIFTKGANRLKWTREFGRRLDKVKTRSKPLERTREFHKKEQTARKRLESFRTRSKPLERH